MQDKAPDSLKRKSQMQSFPTKPKVESNTKKMLAPTNCKVSPDPTLVMQADGSQIPFLKRNYGKFMDRDNGWL